jgi:hypothetical protein
MDVPRNHPGAFADVGFEHDEFAFDIVEAVGERAVVRFTAANGIVKEYELAGPSLRVKYTVPAAITHFSTECGLSPDYLRLLRSGRDCLQPYNRADRRGWRTEHVAVWLKPEPGVEWEEPFNSRFGHGCMLRLGSDAREFAIELGVSAGLAIEPEPSNAQMALV